MESNTFKYITSQKFRDVAAWYNLRVDVDMSLAEDDRVIIKLDGLRITDFSTETAPSENTDTFVNASGSSHYWFVRANGSSSQAKLYCARAVLIDGSNPTDFGEFTDDGYWQINSLETPFWTFPTDLNTNLVPEMTSNTAPSGIASVDDTTSVGEEAFRAFDRDDSTFWSEANGDGVGALTYQFSSPETVTGYAIRTRSGGTDGNPSTWTFQGAGLAGADDSDFITLDTQSSQSLAVSTLTSYNFTNTTEYSRYRLNVTASSGSPAAGPLVAGLEMFGPGDNALWN